MNLLQIDVPALPETILLRLLIDLAAAIVLARAVYFPLHKRRDYVFSFILFNALIFALCLLLRTASVQIGLAFGLFAVFSIFRYRTVTIPVREMGYFFAAIMLGMINALVSVEGYEWVLAGSNAGVLSLLLLLEYGWKGRRERSIEITCERTDLISKREFLLQELRQRTGLAIHRFEPGPLNLQRDFVVVTAYYFEEPTER